MSDTQRLEWWRPEPPVAVAWTGGATEAEPPVDSGSRVAFRGLIAFTFILIVAPQELVPALAPLRIALVSAIVTLVAAIVARTVATPSRPAFPREVVVALLIAVWALLTMPLSIWPGGAMSTFVNIFGKSLIVFWLIAEVVTTPARLRTLCWLLTLLTVPLALAGLWHYAHGVVGEGAGNRIAGYGSGLAANPNDLALTLNIVLPLTLALAMTSERVVARLTALAIVGLDAATIVVTFSRSGFITLAVILLLGLWALGRRGHWGLVGALVLAAAMSLPFAPSGFAARLGTVTDINSDPTGSSQDRWRDTVAATHYVIDHPIVGAGMGNDLLALNELRGATWRSVHNVYLNYAMDLGLPGLALFLALFGLCLWDASQAERRAAAGGDPSFAMLAGGLRISLLGFSIAGFFYPVAYYFYFYYLAGIAVAVRAIDRDTAADQPEAHALG